jgi:hypothetical protein
MVVNNIYFDIVYFLSSQAYHDSVKPRMRPHLPMLKRAQMGRCGIRFTTISCSHPIHSDLKHKKENYKIVYEI